MTKGLGEGHCLPWCVEGRRSVRLVAIGPTAANIWPGISPVTTGFDTQRASNLLRAFLDVGVEVVDEISSYRQDAGVPLLPPKCDLTFSGGSWAKVEDLQMCFVTNPKIVSCVRFCTIFTILTYSLDNPLEHSNYEMQRRP